MKKYVSLLLVLLMALGMLACGKSKNAQAADQMITDIGTVTENSGALIEKAEQAVDALSDKEWETLENVDLLKQARAKYDEIVEENKRKEEEERKRKEEEEKQRQADMEAAKVASCKRAFCCRKSE